MNRIELADLRGVTLSEGRVHSDRRGNFVKLFESSEAPISVDQVCASSNPRAGTVRGLHLQIEPHGEHKLLWSTTGAIWDVMVDTRPHEPTYGRWAAVELSAESPRLLHVPPGIAHGYQTLTDDAGVAYLIAGRWVPSSARTIAWNDPTLGIDWPTVVSEISDSDKNGLPWPLS